MVFSLSFFWASLHLYIVWHVWIFFWHLFFHVWHIFLHGGFLFGSSNWQSVILILLQISIYYSICLFSTSWLQRSMIIKSSQFILLLLAGEVISLQYSEGENISVLYTQNLIRLADFPEKDPRNDHVRFVLKIQVKFSITVDRV